MHARIPHPQAWDPDDSRWRGSVATIILKAKENGVVCPTGL